MVGLSPIHLMSASAEAGVLRRATRGAFRAMCADDIDGLTWVITLFLEVADDNLEEDILLDNSFADLVVEVRVGATDELSVCPSDLSIDIGFLGVWVEFANEGGVHVVMTSQPALQGESGIQCGEGLASRHSEDDFGDVKMLNVFDFLVVNATSSPLECLGLEGRVPLKLLHVSGCWEWRCGSHGNSRTFFVQAIQPGGLVIRAEVCGSAVSLWVSVVRVSVIGVIGVI